MASENFPSNLQESQDTEPLPEYIEMYNISGQPDITRHSFERYLRNREAAKEIKAVQPVGTRSGLYEELNVLSKKNELTPFIRKILDTGALKDQIVCANWITQVSDHDEREQLQQRIVEMLEHGFATGNLEVQKGYAKLIQGAPKEQVTRLIEEGISSDDIEVRMAYAGQIGWSPREETDRMRERLARFFEQAFESNDLNTLKRYVNDSDMVGQLDWRKRGNLLNRALQLGDPELQELVTGNLRLLNDEAQLTLVKIGFSIGSLKLKKELIRRASFWFLEKEAEEEFKTLVDSLFSDVADGLARESEDEQKEYMALAVRFGGENLAKLIHIGLKSPFLEIQSKSAEAIKRIPKEFISSLIEQALDIDNIRIKNIAAQAIMHAPESEQKILQEKVESLIRGVFIGDDTETQRAYAQMNIFLPVEKQSGLFRMFQEKLGNSIIDPSLYKSEAISSEKFSRNAFEKTGSGTTLLGGDLKNKTIIRHLTPEAFLAWERLYEDYEMWKNEGFDYVPVEPIQSFQLTKENMVDVYSGVLDINSAAWIFMRGPFLHEIEQDISKIIKVLEKQKFTHGHTHFGNFCLRFWRNEDGTADLSRKPRVYLIDFDRAASL